MMHSKQIENNWKLALMQTKRVNIFLFVTDVNMCSEMDHVYFLEVQ